MRFRDISSAVRIELLEPLSQRPSRRYLLQLVTSNVQSFFNELTNTGRPWAISETVLSVTEGKNEYPLAAANVARVFDVTTKNDSNPAHREIPVPFWDINELRHNWDAPRDTAWANLPFTDGGHTARRIAFFRKRFLDPVYAQIWPIPRMSAEYRVLYGVAGSSPDLALDESPLLASHHDLIVVKTALDAVVGSAWFADEKENRLRRNELTASFERRLPLLMDQFRTFTRSMTQDRSSTRLSYSID